MLRVILLLSLILRIILGYGQSNNLELLGPNVVRCPGFEENFDDWKLSSQARIDQSQGYSSGASLHMSNADPQNRPTGTYQRLDISPGSTIYFKAKVKGKNIQTDAKEAKSDGARIYVQAYNEFGKVMGGRYPAGSGQGTFDWKEISGEYTVPTDAAYITLAAAFNVGISGEAWFDDFTVQLEKPPFIEAFLLKPHYRGIILANEPQLFKEEVRVNRLDYSDNQAPIVVSYEIKDIRQKTIEKFRFELDGNWKDGVLEFSPKNKLKPGDYSLIGQYQSKLNGSTFTRSHRLEVLPAYPATYIDGDGFTIKDGQKIFPFGLFIGHPEENHLKRIKDAGFNTVISYGYGLSKAFEEYLDRAEKYNLQVLYSIKDLYDGRVKNQGNITAMDMARDYVNAIKYKPALLAWYTVDELLPNWIPQIASLYEEVQKLDPNHPTLQVHYYDGYRMLEKYYYTSDIIATDPYPVGREDLSLTSTRVGAGLKATHQTRGHWAVLQSMDWAVYQKERAPKPPNLAELRNQCYQALIHGAKGILFYSYYDMFQEKYPRQKTENYEVFEKRWPDMKAMAAEMNTVFPLVLDGKRVEPIILANNKIELGAVQYGQEIVLLLANPFYESREVSIELPENWVVNELRQEEIDGVKEANKLTLRLPSLASGPYKLKINP